VIGRLKTEPKVAQKLNTKLSNRNPIQVRTTNYKSKYNPNSYKF